MSRWCSWLRHCATSRQVAGSIPDSVIGLLFFIDVAFRSHYGTGVDSYSNRNEYHEYFLENKFVQCLRLTTLPPSCADCLEVWEPQISRTLSASPDLYRDWFALLVGKAYISKENRQYNL